MEQSVKQQAVERLKQANHILVTVSTSPNVDQLSACIGLTLMLNAMGKHATAVYSGQTPSIIEFLQPERTITPTTDSLRDFIISLDKEKADKLRYKVENDVVRIFITPYRTTITEADLIFSQGDVNVEVIVALGINNKDQLDKAISAHGRILHDATVITMAAGDSQPSQLGQLNWHEPTASSLCEMIVSISEAFGSGLIDNQMATAFLTGIVSQTKRFSNERTSPKVMTMSAQLMAAGANQQLIATKLEPELPKRPAEAHLPEVSEQPQSPEPTVEKEAPEEDKKDKTELDVPHDAKKAASDTEIVIDEQGRMMDPKEAALKDRRGPEKVLKPLEEAELGRPEDEKPGHGHDDGSRHLIDPSAKPSTGSPLNGLGQEEPPSVDPFSQPINKPRESEQPKGIELPAPDPQSIADMARPGTPVSAPPPLAPADTLPTPEPAHQHENDTLSQIEEEVRKQSVSPYAHSTEPDAQPPAPASGNHLENARSAVEQAIGGDVLPPAPTDQPQQPMPPGMPPTPPAVPPPIMPFPMPPDQQPK